MLLKMYYYGKKMTTPSAGIVNLHMFFTDHTRICLIIACKNIYLDISLRELSVALLYGIKFDK